VKSATINFQAPKFTSTAPPVTGTRLVLGVAVLPPGRLVMVPTLVIGCVVAVSLLVLVYGTYSAVQPSNFEDVEGVTTG